MNDINELSYLKLLSSTENIGPQKILALKSHFKSFENLYSSTISEMIKVEGIHTSSAGNIIKNKNNFESTKKNLAKEFEQLNKQGAKLITYWDEEYPSILRNIYYPPVILYVKGNAKINHGSKIAIVGTRTPTHYGKLQAENFAADLVDNNLIIVSGMARGIDSVAHNSALKKGGTTFAVIGSGLDIVYPSENKKLFDQICENGLVISEFELGTKPDAQNFPKRNRIISGLSLATLVIETRINGGAIQTANYAYDQDREVFAVPGNVNSQFSDGCNYLIKKNIARLVTSVQDILVELNIKLDPKSVSKLQPELDLNLFEAKILSVLSEEPIYIDHIAEKTEMATSECLVNLLTLEFKGAVKQFPGKMFVRI